MPLTNLICHIAMVQAKSFRFARCEICLICWHCKISETKSYTSQSQDDFDNNNKKPKLNCLFDLHIISSSTQNNNEKKKKKTFK